MAVRQHGVARHLQGGGYRNADVGRAAGQWLQLDRESLSTA
jgi:hypothetical protein